MFVIVIMNPYEPGEVDDVVGPFDTHSDADDAAADYLSAGDPFKESYVRELKAPDLYLELLDPDTLDGDYPSDADPSGEDDDP